MSPSSMGQEFGEGRLCSCDSSLHRQMLTRVEMSNVLRIGCWCLFLHVHSGLSWGSSSTCVDWTSAKPAQSSSMCISTHIVEAENICFFLDSFIWDVKIRFAFKREFHNLDFPTIVRSNSIIHSNIAIWLWLSVKFSMLQLTVINTLLLWKTVIQFIKKMK